MFKYPIFYFTMRQEDFEGGQLSYLLNCDKVASDVKGETGIEGLLVDFNSGVRVQVQVPKGNWHIRLSDYDSGLVGYDADVAETILVSAEKFYIRWQVEAYLDGEKVFEHVMDLQGAKIFVYIPGHAMGTTISVLPYIRAFKEQHEAEIYLQPPAPFVPLCRQYLPEMILVDEIPQDAYATFYVADFDHPPHLLPVDSRRWTPAMSAQAILGVHGEAAKLHFYPTEGRQIAEPYVCIGVQASGIMKRWLYPEGWDMVVAYLREVGYRVLCIDGEKSFSKHGYEVKIPVGAEDFTGRRPLMERINLLAYADFVIGLGSGLSWLADACGVPVVLISGFSLPIGEFPTKYRVQNYLVCHGCYNDVTVNWKNDCKYLGGPREYECSKKISPVQVVEAIQRVMRDIGRL